MTEGTSQGLFVVVAIVIFGIFVGLSYTLFGDTLKPAMASLFTESTNQATKYLAEHGHKNFFEDEKLDNPVSLKNQFTARGATTLTVDDVITYDENNSLHLYFNGLGTHETITNDLVLWLTHERFYTAVVDDIITLKFYAKSADTTLLKGRLGGNYYDTSVYKGVTINSEWNYYEFSFPITTNKDTVTHTPAFVLWSEEERNLWISDIKIELNSE